MSEEQKLANVNVSIDLQFTKLASETDEDFEKRVHKIVYYINLKEVDYTLTIKEVKDGKQNWISRYTSNKGRDY